MVEALRSDRVHATCWKRTILYVAIYENEAAIQSMRPDFARLAQLHPFAVAVTDRPGETCDFVSRYFKPSYGMPEDPVTGSAHCVLTPYWAQRLGRAPLLHAQVSERGGELWCEDGRDPESLFKGNAVLTLRGTLVI